MAIGEVKQCEHCRNGMHRLCDDPRPVVTLNSFQPAERFADKETVSCCDGKTFWTNPVHEE